MSSDHLLKPQGPYRAHDLRAGEPYELSNGHIVECMPTGGRGSLATGAGYKALANDPETEDVGIDAGFAPVSGTMRAPDLSVGKIADAPGWVHGVPKLAVEYADTGQDEESLAQKIADLFQAGTQYIWVVRLDGPRRVEVHEPGQPVRKALPGSKLKAPGVLAHPVLVEALYDYDVANEVDFHHILRRLTGHENLDEVRDEAKAKGKAEGKAEAVFSVLEAREIAVSDDVRARIRSCGDLSTLDRWLRRAMTATSDQDVMAS